MQNKTSLGFSLATETMLLRKPLYCSSTAKGITLTAAGDSLQLVSALSTSLSLSSIVLDQTYSKRHQQVWGQAYLIFISKIRHGTFMWLSKTWIFHVVQRGRDLAAVIHILVTSGQDYCIAFYTGQASIWTFTPLPYLVDTLREQLTDSHYAKVSLPKWCTIRKNWLNEVSRNSKDLHKETIAPSWHNLLLWKWYVLF